MVVLPEPCRPHISTTAGRAVHPELAGVLAAERRGELVAHDLDHLLGRRQALEHLLAERLLLDPGEELLDHPEVDVGFEQREPDLLQRRGEVLLGDPAFALQAAEDVLELVLQTFEHAPENIRPRYCPVTAALSRTPMDRRAKIVATLGPATADERMLDRLLAAGADVLRFNLSHGNQDSHRRALRLVRKVARARGLHIPVLLDLMGPRYRLGEISAAGRASSGKAST